MKPGFQCGEDCKKLDRNTKLTESKYGQLIFVRGQYEMVALTTVPGTIVPLKNRGDISLVPRDISHGPPV